MSLTVNAVFMLLKLDAATRLSFIQEIFSGFYPFLKIEFYSRPPGQSEMLAALYLITPSQTIGEAVSADVSGLMQIKANQSITASEQEFYQRFGLFSHIWRMGKNGWLQEWYEKNLSVYEFNELGQEDMDETLHANWDANG
jgi:hypothetical protein